MYNWALVILSIIRVGLSISEESFIATFQDGITNVDFHVDYHYMKYVGPIPWITDFTACHWMNIRYFSKELMPIWSYCMVRNDAISNDTECVQLSFIPTPSSANRNVKTQIFLPWYRIPSESINKAIHIELKLFKHRTWAHVCWTYSSDTCCHVIYYNGARMGKVCDKAEEISRWEISSSTNVSKHSVIIGQEQDEVGENNFDPHQTINGQLTELNIWDMLSMVMVQ